MHRLPVSSALGENILLLLRFHIDGKWSAEQWTTFLSTIDDLYKKYLILLNLCIFN
jgi:hypothetical protein